MHYLRINRCKVFFNRCLPWISSNSEMFISITNYIDCLSIVLYQFIIKPMKFCIFFTYCALVAVDFEIRNFFIIIVTNTAITQCIFINTCNAARDYYAWKTVTFKKSFFTNAYNAVLDCYACKVWAIIKGTPANFCNTVWDCYGCKAFAYKKCIITNVCNAVWYCYAC